ncbi:hypothetical protein [Parapedobacter koreensis]|uniref:Uncharacterized protein n=1 Tax=Parapedobacter koreensis TaxID=332977 RepID=A0A1H7MEM5_9SPHI|nr:hypothetical protein [Parapedobacter koreensis]SEL09358.1 hypothetical protein SAMN05421740_103475 [Parapedobacter koreensis]
MVKLLKKWNLFALVGVLTIAFLTYAFTPKQKSKVMVTYPIEQDDQANGRWRLSNDEAETGHSCGGNPTAPPCTATFDSDDIIEEGGELFVLKENATTSGLGPYTPPAR